MQKLPIPVGTQRLILRTDNTAKSALSTLDAWPHWPLELGRTSKHLWSVVGLRSGPPRTLEPSGFNSCQQASGQLSQDLYLDLTFCGPCRGLMHRTAFASGYTGMTASGAEWVVANLPAIRLVGIDYTSIAVFEDISGPHVPLLSKVRPSAARKLTLLASLLQAEQAHPG